MASPSLARSRAHYQQISTHQLKHPADVAAWLGAMQAQDFAGAKWSIGLRLPGATDETIEQAIADGSLIRTWALRGTLHFVAARDVHWILGLIAPRLHAHHRTYYRKLELPDAVLHKSQRIMQRVLQGGAQLTRKQLLQEIEDGGISVQGLRANFILLSASVDGIICPGPRQDKEFTFVLLDEWIKPPATAMPRDEALANLAKRYFKSHGPATLQDFIWWSGLPRTDAQAAMDYAARSIKALEADGNEYWLPRTKAVLKKNSAIQMLPGFDEYLLGYTDRSAMLEPTHARRVVSNKNGLYNATLLQDGKVIGTWRRTFVKDTVSISVKPFTPFSKAQHRAVAQAVKRYGSFLGMTPVLTS